MSNDKFWIVWSPNGARPPQHRHDTEPLAEKEARRLALQNPGEQFFVLEAKKVAISNAVVVTNLLDIPF